MLIYFANRSCNKETDLGLNKYITMYYVHIIFSLLPYAIKLSDRRKIFAQVTFVIMDCMYLSHVKILVVEENHDF